MANINVIMHLAKVYIAALQAKDRRGREARTRILDVIGHGGERNLLPSQHVASSELRAPSSRNSGQLKLDA
jgi:hypothetical protein